MCAAAKRRSSRSNSWHSQARETHCPAALTTRTSPTPSQIAQLGITIPFHKRPFKVLSRATPFYWGRSTDTQLNQALKTKYHNTTVYGIVFA
jgi:hypothetical protein